MTDPMTSRSTGVGPLAGVRVLELAALGPAPFAGMLLADLGADVVRVDRPGGQPMAVPPATDVTNRNKRSVLLDLKAADGKATVLDLAARADVLLEGFRPGVVERLGVGPEAALARNPRLVYGRMTGWGQDGPLAASAGHDIGYLATAGTLGLIGPAGGPPAIPANLLGDYAGGALYLVSGVLAALRHAERTGEGQVVDSAIVDGVAHLGAMLWGLLGAGLWRDARGTNLLDGGCPYYAVYATADGGWMAVGALEERFYAEFARLLPLPADAPDRGDVTRWPELRALIAERFAARSRAAWTALFEGTDACVAPVLSLREAAAHPQLAARGTLVTADGLTQPAPAPRFSRTPGALRRPPAEPGAHTAEVAADWDVAGLRGPGAAGAGDGARQPGGAPAGGGVGGGGGGVGARAGARPDSRETTGS
ncbi:CaiB/BaiF CoA-transferase family protein [Streptomyces sp. DSM 44915]|uniref:CaiB/BaiF CoA-transferase family protein n=1 Tax=Streptomyces chisholmiae TaxID=3075540 RepID=A0ABU2JII1_9ACTN|nr:CaiB/BaiF CoA-transferase family protein [Streptomyces sp. DSM 44915]MDT0264727.1 CaiB/BaiF CoA-transferase family protein [Streptomyces sp. DSM 44915]